VDKIGFETEVESLYHRYVNEMRPSKTERGGFGDTLLDAINKVNTQRNESEDAIKRLVSGENKDIHQTMITMEKASISMQLLMKVRSKIINAYQEIMRTQV